MGIDKILAGVRLKGMSTLDVILTDDERVKLEVYRWANRQDMQVGDVQFGALQDLQLHKGIYRVVLEGKVYLLEHKGIAAITKLLRAL